MTRALWIVPLFTACRDHEAACRAKIEDFARRAHIDTEDWMATS